MDDITIEVKLEDTVGVDYTTADDCAVSRAIKRQLKAWSWWWVFSPLLIGWGIMILIIIIVAIIHSHDF